MDDFYSIKTSIFKYHFSIYTSYFISSYYYSVYTCIPLLYQCYITTTILLLLRTYVPNSARASAIIKAVPQTTTKYIGKMQKKHKQNTYEKRIKNVGEITWYIYEKNEK